MKDSDLLTMDNIGGLGFEYNYFEGYTYSHKDGYMIRIPDAQKIHYKGKWYECKTISDFRALANES